MLGRFKRFNDPEHKAAPWKIPWLRTNPPPVFGFACFGSFFDKRKTKSTPIPTIKEEQLLF